MAFAGCRCGIGELPQRPASHSATDERCQSQKRDRGSGAKLELIVERGGLSIANHNQQTTGDKGFAGELMLAVPVNRTESPLWQITGRTRFDNRLNEAAPRMGTPRVVFFDLATDAIAEQLPDRQPFGQNVKPPFMGRPAIGGFIANRECAGDNHRRASAPAGWNETGSYY